jgi:hypothetical protein
VEPVSDEETRPHAEALVYNVRFRTTKLELVNEEVSMNRSKVFVVNAIGVVLLALALVGAAVSVHAQADPFIGTWKLNVAKSKYNPGPPPKSQSSVYAVAGKGVRITTTGIGADGKPINQDTTANYDGKDSTTIGSPDYNITSLKRIDANTVEIARKKGGKVVQTATNVLSKDGKTRTLTTKGTNAQGQTINNVAVWDRQ